MEGVGGGRGRGVICVVCTGGREGGALPWSNCQGSLARNLADTGTDCGSRMGAATVAAEPAGMAMAVGTDMVLLLVLSTQRFGPRDLLCLMVVAHVGQLFCEKGLHN